MAQLPFSGPISLADLQATFIGAANSLSGYYAGGPNVPAGTVGYPGGVATPIPSSGAISLSNFYGSQNSLTLGVAVIAGGGGGGDSGGWEGGGGGGGGGLHVFTSYNVTGSNPVVVGAGGAFRTSGQKSSFRGVVATGGGAGGYNYTTGDFTGAPGGSGGGGTRGGGGGAGTSGQGYAGGYGPIDSAGGSGGSATGAGGTGAWYSTPPTASAAGYVLTVAGQTFVCSKGGEGGGFNRYGNGQRGAAGAWPGGGGGGDSGVGTSNVAGKDGAVLIWYSGSTVKASGGNSIYVGSGQVLHVFTSNGTFALL